MGLSTTTVSFFILLAPLAVLAQSEQLGEAPVCLAGDNSSNCNANNDDTKMNTNDDNSDANYKCNLWMAKSLIQPEIWSLFTGKDQAKGERVATPDVLVPVTDSNKNEWSPHHEFLFTSDLVHQLPLESNFLSDIFSPGAGSIAMCSDSFANIEAEQRESQDSAGVHRSKNATAGSFSDRYNFAFRATRDIVAGEEMVIPCDDMEAEANPFKVIRRKGRSLEWLAKNGICLDNFAVASSTLAGVGRGAFTKRFVKKGQVIGATPVVHFDRSQLEIVEQSTEPDEYIPGMHQHGIQYTEKVEGQQLLLNYAYGHPDSNILLLPYAPGVSFINHSRENTNAVIRWSDWAYEDNWLELDPNLLLENPSWHELMFEIVALRDILPGEEVFIDYGDEWIAAWDNHVNEWEPDQDKDYVSAADFRRLNSEPIRTVEAQESEPYPENLRTACYFMPTEEFNEDAEIIEWDYDMFNCLRPCDIQERHVDDGRLYYTAVVYPMGIAVEPAHCGRIPEEGVTVTYIPINGVEIVDQPYSTDAHLESAFRHEIGVPDELFPDIWMAADSNPMGDFIPTPLKPGQIDVIRWSDTGKVVTPNAYRLGLHSGVRDTLLEYCNKMGITDYFHHLTTSGNAAPEGKNADLDLQGEKWYLQRPEKFWKSNLQWISPGENSAQQSYLEALSIAGFDDILAGIGETLGMDGLVAFHVTFIGVSYSTKGYMHYDVSETGAKAFNVIIPLILANETGPELDVQESELVDEDEDFLVGRYRYEYNVASMLGDDAYHATSAVDYRMNKEFRMAATIYIADINDDNADSVMNEYTQAYPPADRNLLLSWAGTHWKKDDPSVSLPKPSPNHILLQEKDAEATA